MNQLGSHDQEEKEVTNKEFFCTIKKKALLILLTASALVTGVSVSYLAGNLIFLNFLELFLMRSFALHDGTKLFL